MRATILLTIFLSILNPFNLYAETETPSLSLANCYTSTAKKGASTFDGRVAVGILCKQKNDLLLNDQVSARDTSGARPVIERKRLILNNQTPNGVEYGMIASGGTKKFYEVQVGIVCCPTVVASTTSK